MYFSDLSFLLSSLAFGFTDWIVSLANSMSIDETDEIIEIMSNGARRAREVGYDGVEIQASYGYPLLA
jgi:2,4-dienoyl-CoA reductase-like NADH-dependent reductase (Old Yellow Enzyme family)